MKVPIVKQDQYLIASLPSPLADGDFKDLRDTLVRQVGRSHARGVIVDLSALDVMDSFATHTLGDLASKIRRRGSEMVLVGIQPDVAVAALRLGFKIDFVATAQGLEEGLSYLSQKAWVPQDQSGAPG